MRSQYLEDRLQALPGLVGVVFLLAATLAGPLHLLEGSGNAWPSTAEEAGNSQPAGIPGTLGQTGSPEPADAPPFPAGHTDCLSCMAMALAPRTAPAASFIPMPGPDLRIPTPTWMAPVGRVGVETEARPRAPPSV